MPKIIALDADGVLLDYNKAAAAVWEETFGLKPPVKNPVSYHIQNMYELELDNVRIRELYYGMFDKIGWWSMPPMPNAVEGCQLLADAGYSLHVVSSMPVQFQEHRVENFKKLGIPITSVTATGMSKDKQHNPKTSKLLELQPVAFVDDLIDNFRGVEHLTHCALLEWNTHDCPNIGKSFRSVSSTHPDMLHFARYWLSQDF